LGRIWIVLGLRRRRNHLEQRAQFDSALRSRWSDFFQNVFLEAEYRFQRIT
jgi:hypothetical protein